MARPKRGLLTCKVKREKNGGKRSAGSASLAARALPRRVQRRASGRERRPQPKRAQGPAPKSHSQSRQCRLRVRAPRGQRRGSAPRLAGGCVPARARAAAAGVRAGAAARQLAAEAKTRRRARTAAEQRAGAVVDAVVQEVLRRARVADGVFVPVHHSAGFDRHGCALSTAERTRALVLSPRRTRAAEGAEV